MMRGEISDKARKIDEFVEKLLEFKLHYTFLLIIDIILEHPDWNYSRIARELNESQAMVNIDEDGVKANFNYHKHYISKAILKATGSHVKIRKKCLKNTLKRYIFSNNLEILGKLEGYRKEIFTLLNNEHISEEFQIQYLMSIRNICCDIIDICDQNN